MEWVYVWVSILCFVLHTHTCIAVTREFYIACEEEVWDYAPGGSDSNIVSGYDQTSSASTYLNHSANRIGHKYKKVLYKEYSDHTFTFHKPKPVWLGFLGPVLAAEVGDTVLVHFKNLASRPYSIHPHGIQYNRDNEGVRYSENDSRADVVQPGQNFTYTWTVSELSGPAEGDPDCISWLYHSHVAPVKDIASGLVGFLLTCRKGKLVKWEKTRLYALYFSVVDENLSWYLDDNIASSTSANIDTDDEDFQESNKMHAINGYVYGHLPGLSACVGETIHWHMASLGTEVDVHSIAVSGHSFEHFHHREASIPLTVASFATASMMSFTKGQWSLHCQVDQHLTGGMEAFLTIDNCEDFKRPDIDIAHTRRYYITAEETLWNYAPSGRNRYDGGDLTEEGSDSEIFFKSDSSHIGGEYKKVLFYEYADYRFRQRKSRTPEEEHLGFLGPVIRAEVGDQIKVVFYNKASRPFSVHAHGVHFSKYSEGYLNNDGYDGGMKRDDSVSPGRIYTYYWNVPEDVGPAEDDPPCLTRMYTSGVDVIKDSNSGLVGPLLICRKGALDSAGRQVNVSSEFFFLLSATDENKSWFLKDNIATSSVHLDVDTDSAEFVQSNIMHGINGRLYGNLEGVTMCKGGVASLHVFSVGGVSDLCTLTFKSDTFRKGSTHKVSSGLIPGTMSTLALVPHTAGSWGFYCGQADKFKTGAKAIYRVNPCNISSPPEASVGGDTVRVYLQAELTEWDYLPGGMDHITNKTVHRDAGTTYMKSLFTEYTNEAFRRKARRDSYLGFLGPIIRVEVGDVLQIVFRNSVPNSYFSVRAQGLVYNQPKNNHTDVTFEPGIGSGETITYSWNISQTSGPGAGGPVCITRLYYSAVDYVRDVNSGLIGPLIICRKGELRRYGSVKLRTSVEKDIVGFFGVTDENKSWFLGESIEKSGGKISSDESLSDSNVFHSINGYIYGSGDKPFMNEGSDVDWYLINMGTQGHSIHFLGNDVISTTDGFHSNDVVPLLAMETSTVRMRAINIGDWLYYCHVGDHSDKGMRAMYQVKRTKKRIS